MGLFKLPFHLRAFLHQRFYRCPTSIQKGFVYKVAETQEELEQAFELLYLCQSRMGKKKESKYNPWISKYNALPTTKILIAVRKGKVAAVASLIQKGSFGLPVEEFFQFPVLPMHAKAAQLGGAAVLGKYQDHAHMLGLSLLKFAYQLSLDYLSVTHFVFAENSKSFRFYDCLMDLTPLALKDPKLNNVEAGIIDLRETEKWRTDFLAFLHHDTDMIKNPENEEYFAIRPYLKTEFLRFLFFEQSQIFQTLSDFEKFIVKEVYPSLENFAPIANNVIPLKTRRERRYEIRFHTVLPNSVQVEIQNIAYHGLGGIMSAPVPLGPCQITLELSDGTYVDLKGKILWQTPQGYFGFSIDSPPLAWKEFILDLENSLAVAA